MDKFSSTHIMILDCPIRWIESLEYLVAKGEYLANKLMGYYKIMEQLNEKFKNEEGGEEGEYKFE